MTLYCHCCGQTIPGLARSTLGAIVFEHYQKAILFGELYHNEEGRTLRQLVDKLYEHDPDGGPEHADNVVQAALSKIRVLMKPYGWTITHSPDYKIVRLNEGTYRKPMSRASRLAGRSVTR